MAIKTFASGEILTASDTNTYLANAGLVYVTETTATSGTTLSVNNCFTSTYASYLLVIDGLPTASAYGLTVQLRTGTTNTATGYYWGATGVDVGAGTALTIRGNNDTYWQTYAIADTSGRASCVAQIINPQLAQYTAFSCQSTDTRGGTGYAGINSGGQLKNTTQYDGFSLAWAGGTGTISNLQVKVYGYRQA